MRILAIEVVVVEPCLVLGGAQICSDFQRIWPLVRSLAFRVRQAFVTDPFDPNHEALNL